MESKATTTKLPLELCKQFECSYSLICLVLKLCFEVTIQLSALKNYEQKRKRSYNQQLTKSINRINPSEVFL